MKQRLAFVVLVLVLGAFELLFVSEARQARASIDAQLALRTAKASETVETMLSRSLDVAEARIEALQTLPQGDGEGLLWFEGDVQRLPRGAHVEVTVGDEPAFSDGWWVVRRGHDVHGLAVDTTQLRVDLEELLVARGTMEAGDALEMITPPVVRLISPRLDGERSAVMRALALKTLLLLAVVMMFVLAQRQREAHLAAQRQFVATISHELRTPLAAIRVMAETLERKLPVDGLARDYPHRIVSAAEGLGVMVENVLSFSRLEAGKVVPLRSPFQWALIEPWLREAAALQLEKSVTLELKGLESIPDSMVDATLIRLLISNLFQNACTHGGSTFRVDARVEGEWVVVLFSDDGPGIPRESWERVFGAFERLGKGGGAGLGLAVSRMIARVHGGDLKLISGSGFELRIPKQP